jgi:hypothetical protein
MAVQVEVYLQGASSIFVSAEDGQKIKNVLSSGEVMVTVRELSGNLTTISVAKIVRLETHGM